MDKRIGWNNGRETEETDIQTGRETERVGKTERERERLLWKLRCLNSLIKANLQLKLRTLEPRTFFNLRKTVNYPGYKVKKDYTKI